MGDARIRSVRLGSQRSYLLPGSDSCGKEAAAFAVCRATGGVSSGKMKSCRDPRLYLQGHGRIPEQSSRTSDSPRAQTIAEGRRDGITESHLLAQTRVRRGLIRLISIRLSGNLAPSMPRVMRNLRSPSSCLAFLHGLHNNLAHVSAPPFERNPTLVKKFVALVDGRDAGDRTGLMIEHLIGNVWSNSQTRHPRYARAPQIVKTPSRNPGDFVKFVFGSREGLERFGSRSSKHVWPLPLHAL